ncbi:hypothetical protein VTN49DRAFT_837 [Thermomyces lanuginosus]|uniref:uncharacterized protein n=1 Tax=Thermomyces lanuginosus TaxID=5541 RepID=UPI0037447382
MSSEQREPPKWSRTDHSARASRALNSPNWRVKGERNMPDAVPSGNSQDAFAEGRRLYVGNLPYVARREDVEGLFPPDQYRIVRMDFSVDPFTSRNPSYCFVDMETKEQADRAMRELNGVDLLGRPVKIRPGVPPKSPRSSANNGARGLATRASFTFDRWTRTDAEQHFKGYSAQGRRLYVGGLPKLFNQAAIDAKINQFFSGFQIEAISKIIPPPKEKRDLPGDRHYLFVDFASSEEASRAIEALDGKVGPWGGRLKIAKARGDSWKPDERQYWIPGRRPSEWLREREKHLQEQENAGSTPS